MARTIIVMLGLLLAAGVGVGCGGAEPADGVAVTYRAVPLERGPATRQMVDRAVAIVRRRLATLDVRHATASRSGAMIRVTVAAADKKTLTEGDVTAVGRLAFYDWEPNVIGPDGKPAPSDPAVTGGASAGTPGAGSVSHDVAVRRAAKRSPTATGSRGTLVVRAETPPGSHPVDQWYVLDDAPALTGSDITHPGSSVDHATKAAAVTFDFTPDGARRWKAVTRRIARRGQAARSPGTPAQAAAQHFAVVLDDDLLAVPYIDFESNPDGIDASNGSQIEGGFTAQSARRLAAVLTAGALPVRLRQVSVKRVALP